jgi:DNA mismatch repair protein MutH
LQALQQRNVHMRTRLSLNPRRGENGDRRLTPAERRQDLRRVLREYEQEQAQLQREWEALMLMEWLDADYRY